MKINRILVGACLLAILLTIPALATGKLIQTKGQKPVGYFFTPYGQDLSAMITASGSRLRSYASRIAPGEKTIRPAYPVNGYMWFGHLKDFVWGHTSVNELLVVKEDPVCVEIYENGEHSYRVRRYYEVTKAVWCGNAFKRAYAIEEFVLQLPYSPTIEEVTIIVITPDQLEEKPCVEAPKEEPIQVIPKEITQVIIPACNTIQQVQQAPVNSNWRGYAETGYQVRNIQTMVGLVDTRGSFSTVKVDKACTGNPPTLPPAGGGTITPPTVPGGGTTPGVIPPPVTTPPNNPEHGDNPSGTGIGHGEAGEGPTLPELPAGTGQVQASINNSSHANVLNIFGGPLTRAASFFIFKNVYNSSS